MEEDERMNFNSFVDAYNAYQNPNLAPVAPAFAGYNYQAPQLNMVQAPNQLPPMSINPDAIYDPTVGAAMQILNRPMMMAQTPGLLGSGTEYQQQFGLLPDIAPVRMQQYQKIAPPAPPAGLMDYMGGGGDAHGGYGYDGGYYIDNYDHTLDPQRDAQSGGSRAPDWVGLPADIRNAMTGGYDPSSGQSYAEAVGLGGDYGYSGYSSGEYRGE